MEKGEELRFIRGTYAGMLGWRNNSAKKSGKMSPCRSVIVQLEDEDGEPDGEKAT